MKLEGRSLMNIVEEEECKKLFCCTVEAKAWRLCRSSQYVAIVKDGFFVALLYGGNQFSRFFKNI